MGIGGGYYLTSIAGTSLALAILVLFRKIPRSYHTVRTYHIIVAAEDQAVEMPVHGGGPPFGQKVWLRSA